SMSLGRPGIGRRSSPTIRQPTPWWSRRATRRPSRPEMPVTTHVFTGASLRSSPEDMLPSAQAHVDHRLDPVLDGLHALGEIVVVVVGIAGEPHRLAEVHAVLH